MGVGTLIQNIQAVLAPAVMVSSAALLLLGWHTKFSNLATRFRALHHERRLLAGKADRTDADNDRLRSVRLQLDHLLRRAACVKRAILLADAAIICFMASSALIFFSVYTAAAIGHGAMLVFVAGLACVVASAVVMMVETRLFFTVLMLERPEGG